MSYAETSDQAFEAVALEAAARWASRHLISRKTFRLAVTAINGSRVGSAHVVWQEPPQKWGSLSVPRRIVGGRVVTGQLAEIRYQLFGRSGEVWFPSWTHQVVENETSRSPLRWRLAVLLLLVTIILSTGFGLAFWYSSRHPFYAASGNAVGLWLAPLLLAGLVLPYLSTLGLPRRPEEKRSRWVTAALCMIGVQLTLAATGDPSLRHALRLRAARDYAGAARIAEACVDLNIRAAAARELLDELRDEGRQERELRERGEAAYRAALEEWARTRLLCRDGTSSPTCTCGQSSRQGCCSHHKGVEGCPRERPRKEDWMF